MAIKVQTYESGVGAAALTTPGPATQSASLDTTNTAATRTTKLATASALKASTAFEKEALKTQEIQQAADILDESNKYYEATKVFEADYKAKNEGADARNATEAFDLFHTKQMAERSQRFVGEPRLSLMWQRQGGQIRMGSVGRGIEYSAQQDKVYKADVTKVKSELYLQKIAEAPNDQVVENLRAQYNAEVAAINSPKKTELLMIAADQATAETRINTAIANNDVDEAKRLLSEYREAGSLGDKTDEMVKKVESARIEDDAFQISQEVRILMPDATKTEKLAKAQELSNGDDQVYKSSRYQINQDHSAAASAKKEQENEIRDMFDVQIQQANTPAERKQVELLAMQMPMPPALRSEILTKNSKGLRQPLTSNDAKLLEVEKLVAQEAITQEQLDREYKWSLSKDDYDDASDMLKTKGGNRVTAYNLAMEDRMVKAFAEDSKSLRKVKTKRFKAGMKQFTKEFQTNNKRLPTDQEMQEQENWMMEQVIYDENWYGDTTTSRFMLDTLDPEDFDVPDEMAKQIRSQYKAIGKDLTDEQVTAKYKAYLMDKSGSK